MTGMLDSGSGSAELDTGKDGDISDIPGATDYDETETDASEGGFGASPGTSGFSAVADPETEGRDATGIKSINTDDAADITRFGVETGESVSQTASNAAEAVNNQENIFLKLKLVLGLLIVGVFLYLLKPVFEIGAGLAGQ